MIKTRKGDVFYFINIYPEQNDFLYLKIEAAKDSETEHGMATLWKVLETNKHWFSPGEYYSGNQFDGVALDGLARHIFDTQKDLIKHIWERKR